MHEVRLPFPADPVQPGGRRRIGGARCAATVFALVLALGGCGPSAPKMAEPEGVAPAAARAMAPGPSAGTPANVKLAYSHALVLAMPSASIKPRYQRALDRCISDIGLGCIIISASFNAGDAAEFLPPTAALSVRLPHGSVAAFEADLLAPLPGQASGDAFLRSRATSAEDLTRTIADLEQRQTQLTDYRERLTALARRTDAKVEDLIKIESELSNVQSELESIAGQRKGLDERVATESLAIDFRSQSEAGTLLGPIVQAWREAGGVLGDNAGNAIRFVVAALPWAPIAGIGLVLLRLTVRRWRR